MPRTDAAHECYERLLAARRIVTAEELEEMKRDADRERMAHRIRRRLPKVY